VSCVTWGWPIAHHKEADMHDMIGASGMVQGWATVWHMELVWLLIMLVVSVTATTLVESLIATLRPHRPEASFGNARAALKAHIWVAKTK